MQLGNENQSDAKKYKYHVTPGNFLLNSEADTIDPKMIGVSEQIPSDAIDMMKAGIDIAEGNKMVQ